MCQAWSVSFQKGMHYHLRPNLSVLLMSRRQGAPYRDRIEETERVLVYEGHDVSRSHSCPKPKSLDQTRATPMKRFMRESGYSTDFLGSRGCWREQDGTRSVFKFQLELAEDLDLEAPPPETL